jgi:hypothetical protein
MAGLSLCVPSTQVGVCSTMPPSRDIPLGGHPAVWATGGVCSLPAETVNVPVRAAGTQYAAWVVVAVTPHQDDR